jgi:hypothetical protein
MYALNLSKPKSARGVPPSARARRDDVMPPLADPDMAPLDDTPAAPGEPTVQAVTAVQPQMKKFRATICRTVTQSAIVEYEALETQGQYSVAEDLAAQVPADAWTTDPANSWCYIDKLDDLGPASAAIEPAAPEQAADDDTMTDPNADDPTTDPDDETLPLATAGRGNRRHAKQKRMTVDDITSTVNQILDQAQQVWNASGGDADTSDAQDAVEQLQELAEQLEALQNEPVDDAQDGDDVAGFLADAADQINGLIEDAQNAAADAELDPAA